MASSREEVVVTLKDEFSKAAQNINSSVTALKAGFAAFAGSELVKGLSSSVVAFADAEKRTIQLGFALKSMGKFSQDTLNDYKSFAEQMKRTTEFTDEQFISVERLLVQYGIYGEQMKRTVKASADLATAQGIDLESAVKILLRALEGGTAGLSKMGIKVSDLELRTKGLNGILDVVEKKVGGFSEAAANSTSGGLKAFTDMIDDLQKSLGEIIAGSGAFKTFVEFTKTLSSNLAPANTELERLNKEIHKLSLQQIEQSKEDPDKLPWYLKWMMSDTESASVKQRAKNIDDALGALIKRRDELMKQTNKDTSNAQQGEDKDKDLKREENYLKMLKSMNNYDRGRLGDVLSLKDQEIREIKNKEKQGAINHEQALALMDAANKRYATDIVSTLGGAFQDAANTINAIVSGDVQSSISSIGTMLSNVGGVIGKWGAAAAGYFNGVISLANGLADVINGDTRTAFERLRDEIDEMNAELNEFIRIKDALENRKEREESGQSVTKDFSKEEFKNFAKDFGLKIPQYYFFSGSESRKIRFEAGPDGTIYLYVGAGSGIKSAYMLPSGVVQMAENPFPLSDEADVMEFFKYIFQTYKGQVNTSTENRAQGGYIGGTDDNIRARLSAGEYVVNRRGVNQRTIGLLQALNSGQMPASGSQSVVIHAIDAQSFEDFMKRQGAEVMKRLSRNNGLVFLDSRGVSSNA